MFKMLLSFLLLLSILSACSSEPSLDLYHQSIDQAKSALHDKEYDSAIELLESALIENPNDNEANTLLEMAKDKKTQLSKAEKNNDDFQLMGEYFDSFINMYNSDFFKDMTIDESVEYLTLSMERQFRLEQILTEVSSIEVDTELIALKGDFEEVINQEIEATLSSSIINLLKDIDHTDPSTDPLNQFGEAMDSWMSTREINNKMVPILQKKFQTTND